MTTLAIKSDAPKQPPQAIVRPYSARAALWINSHPKSTFLALCALAAGYGLALGLGGLSQDVFISVATVGGVVLLVSAYVLKRLIYMPQENRLQYLLGMRVKSGDMFYFFQDDSLHAIKIEIRNESPRLHFGAEGRKKLGLEGDVVTLDLSNPSEDILTTLRNLILENERRSPEQMLRLALKLGEKDAIPTKATITIDNIQHAIHILYSAGFGWFVKMGHEIAKMIFQNPQTYQLSSYPTFANYGLISSRYINEPLLAFLEIHRETTQFVKEY